MTMGRLTLVLLNESKKFRSISLYKAQTSSKQLASAHFLFYEEMNKNHNLGVIWFCACTESGVLWICCTHDIEQIFNITQSP